jgi:RNA polymerase sigma-70 factor (ECF subfamily)
MNHVESDADLIKATIAGTHAAFGVLVKRHERGVFAFVFEVLKDRQLAEDATQEAFLSAYHNLRSLAKHEAFGPWVITIARRKALAIRRPEPVLVGSKASTPAPSEADFDPERLMSALDSLPEPERQVLMLRHFDCQDVAVIAQILGESVGTVTKRISRAHERLRQMLKEYQL